MTIPYLEIQISINYLSYFKINQTSFNFSGELKTASDRNKSARNEIVRKQRKTFTKKGKVYLSTQEHVIATDLRTSSAPVNLYEAVKHISRIPCLRDFVAELGFKKILNLNIALIPSNLAWQILTCYNEKEKSMVFNGEEIKITRDLVHEILGFPKGDLGIHFAKRINYKKLNFNLESFWKQYIDENGKLIVETENRSFSFEVSKKVI
jgi:hypothetical protein